MSYGEWRSGGCDTDLVKESSNMFLLQRARGLRMLGLGFGSGGSVDDDGDKENQPESPKATPPWLKRPKVTEESPDSRHRNLVKTIR